MVEEGIFNIFWALRFHPRDVTLLPKRISGAGRVGQDGKKFTLHLIAEHWNILYLLSCWIFYS